MRVNTNKTQLLCISATATSDVTSYIKSGGTKIESTDRLKILGFMFGNTPSVRPHIDYMLMKARKKMWTMRNLKKAGMLADDMLKVFNTVIRPVFDYAVSTYHSMMTKEMIIELENVQKRACRIIYGWGVDYEQLLADGTVVSLEERRKKMVLNFARKTESKERFKGWFPRKDDGGINLREELTYEEKYARTERLKKSPLFYMRRELNKANGTDN